MHMQSEILKTIDDIHVSGKVVLLRVDFNVPMNNGIIKDDKRMREHLPTIKELMEKGAKIILMTHLGDPQGQEVPELSTVPLAQHLSTLLQKPVQTTKMLGGSDVAFKVKSMKRGDILMLPNLRFHPGEEENDNVFAHKLASCGEIYINDAFATAHREHASTTSIATFFKERAMGRLMEKEMRTLTKIMDDPERPFTVIMGGSKIDTKLPAMKNILEQADHLIVGGEIANTMLMAAGHRLGRSFIDRTQLKLAEDIISWARRDNCALHLPKDCIVADKLENYGYTKEISVEQVGTDEAIYDVGPQTTAEWANIIASSNTVLWNGPVGAFEHTAFETGTSAVAKAVGMSGAFTVCGGGDTLSALRQMGAIEKIDITCTGGGAMLEFLKGQSLPAIKALSYGSQNAGQNLSEKNFNRFLK